MAEILAGRATVIISPILERQKIACLTLDLEQDYGDLLDGPSYEGLEHIPELVAFFEKREIPLTCFVQGSLFETHRDKIAQLSRLDVEFELHSYAHSRPGEMDVEFEITRGREAYQKVLGRCPLGYRSPLGVIGAGDYHLLATNGFKFDSSVFPMLRPGVFNNLRKPTGPFYVNGCQMVEYPLTVFSSVIRIPIALSYIKLLGRPYLQLLKISNLPKLVVFDFHLHDLFQLNSADRLPLSRWSPIYRFIFRRIYQKSKGREGLDTLDELITMLRAKGYSFQKMVDVHEALIK